MLSRLLSGTAGLLHLSLARRSGPTSAWPRKRAMQTRGKRQPLVSATDSDGLPIAREANKRQKPPNRKPVSSIGKCPAVSVPDADGIPVTKPSDTETGTSTTTRYFLVKSEPDDYSVDMLAKDGVSCWDGVRNHQAKNIMKSMVLGDLLFFYHSSCKVPGIVGIAEVVKEAYPDHTAFDSNSKYFDPKSTQDAPRWMMVDIKLVRKLKRCVPLAELKQYSQAQLSSYVA